MNESIRATKIIYPPDGVRPVAVIEFVHGMCEHKGRYYKTMEKFAEHGFICAISDMLGHGDNIASEDDLGYFGERGARGLVEDVRDFTRSLKQEYPNLPFILLGHSMGSLIVRAYTRKHADEIDALIVSGSPSNNAAKKLAKFLIRVQALFHGWRYRSPFMQNLVNGPFEKAFAKEGIVNSWLTTDRSVVEDYNKDPKCGFIFTLNGYYTLMSLMEQVYSSSGWRKDHFDLPIMFMSGEDDPCRISNNAFRKAVKHMKNIGYTNTFHKLYKGKRHELFNEKDNEEVYDDIFKFLEIKVGIDTSLGDKVITFPFEDQSL